MLALAAATQPTNEIAAAMQCNVIQYHITHEMRLGDFNNAVNTTITTLWGYLETKWYDILVFVNEVMYISFLHYTACQQMYSPKFCHGHFMVDWLCTCKRGPKSGDGWKSLSSLSSLCHLVMVGTLSLLLVLCSIWKCVCQRGEEKWSNE